MLNVPQGLRTNCENAYLSWTRNAVICAVVGSGLFLAHGKMPRASIAGIGKKEPCQCVLVV